MQKNLGLSNIPISDSEPFRKDTNLLFIGQVFNEAVPCACSSVCREDVLSHS